MSTQHRGIRSTEQAHQCETLTTWLCWKSNILVLVNYSAKSDITWLWIHLTIAFPAGYLHIAPCSAGRVQPTCLKITFAVWIPACFLGMRGEWAHPVLPVGTQRAPGASGLGSAERSRKFHLKKKVAATGHRKAARGCETCSHLNLWHLITPIQLLCLQKEAEQMVNVELW